MPFGQLIIARQARQNSNIKQNQSDSTIWQTITGRSYA
jgi:hypothetical protein